MMPGEEVEVEVTVEIGGSLSAFSDLSLLVAL